jgi:hypothetical protein
MIPCRVHTTARRHTHVHVGIGMIIYFIYISASYFGASSCIIIRHDQSGKQHCPSCVYLAKEVRMLLTRDQVSGPCWCPILSSSFWQRPWPWPPSSCYF